MMNDIGLNGDQKLFAGMMMDENKERNGRDMDSKDKLRGDRDGRGRGSPSRRRGRSRSPNERSRSSRGESRANRRVYVANVPFDVKWSDLKDLFRDKVGNVSYCQLFEDEQGRSRGCGLVEFQDAASALKAIEVLHRYEYRNRELVVKEDLDCERDRYGRLILPSRREKESRERDRDSVYLDQQTYGGVATQNYNTFGLSPGFLESLGITGPLNNRVFVANLDYKVGEKKLEEIYRLAGKVLRVRLYTETSGTSKGHGTVEYEHPVEAVQAISMFHNQKLYGRPMSVRMDKYECEEMPEVLPSKLPSGLEGVGKGLGIGGQPLNISKSLLNASLAPQVNPVQQTQQAQVQTANSAALNAFNNLAGTLTQLPVTGLSQMASSGPSVSAASALTSSLNIPGFMSADRSMGGLSGTSNLSGGLGQQGLSQTASGLSNLASTAQNVLAAAASLTGNSSLAGVSSALGLSTQSGQAAGNNAGGNLSVYSSYEREFRDKFREPQPISDTIVVRNLPLTFSWQNLRDRFNEIGEVRYAELKNRGTAVVRFHSERDAQRAVDLMNGIRIDNRPVEVSLYY